MQKITTPNELLRYASEIHDSVGPLNTGGIEPERELTARLHINHFILKAARDTDSEYSLIKEAQQIVCAKNGWKNMFAADRYMSTDAIRATLAGAVV